MSILQKALRDRGYERVYFYHVRRVGGTSLNETFFGLNSNHPQLVSSIIRRSKLKVVNLHGTRYVGANIAELERGEYLYGFSHIPSIKLNLPSNTFRVTLFRDPIDRLISHYSMIIDFERRGIDRYWMPLERQWLGKSFADFCHLVPRERLLAQLYMFSPSFSVSEAVRNANGCDYIFRTEDYPNGLKGLSSLLGTELMMRSSHSVRRAITASQGEIESLRELLLPEYEMLSQLER